MDPIISIPESALEPENFRIDSSAWEILRAPNDIWVKTSPDRGVTEYLEGECAGEQLFTLESALKESRKAGKNIPTLEQWMEIVRAACPGTRLKHGSRSGDAFILEGDPGTGPIKLKRCGYRDPDSGAHYFVGGYGYYWTRSRPASLLRFLKGNLLHVGISDNGFGHSVRCLKP